MHAHGMTPRKLSAQSIYLKPEKAALLDALAAETRIPKAVLLREAVDDLLEKFKKLKKATKPKK
jgi:predicted DNA-binding protein